MATIAQTVRCVLLVEGEKYIWYGSTSLLDKCAEKLGYSQLHPIVRTQRILKALEHSADFRKYYIYFEVNGKMRRVRCFQLHTEEH